MVLIKSRIFVQGLVDVAVGKVEITEHPVARRIIRKVFLCLLQQVFGLLLLAFGDVKSSQSSARICILGIGADCSLKLLLCLSNTVQTLIKAAKCNMGGSVLFVEFRGFLKTGLSRVRLISANLQHGKVQVTCPEGRTKLYSLFHGLNGSWNIVLGGIQVR